MPKKLQSRKFWVMVAGEIQGIVILFKGIEAGNTFIALAGMVLTLLVILGYLKAEKDVDVARAKITK